MDQLMFIKNLPKLITQDIPMKLIKTLKICKGILKEKQDKYDLQKIKSISKKNKCLLKNKMLSK